MIFKIATSLHQQINGLATKDIRLTYSLFLVLRFDNLDERTVMVSSPEAADDKRNLYSPEPFLFDIDFDPNLHNLNSPSTSDVIGKYVFGLNIEFGSL